MMPRFNLLTVYFLATATLVSGCSSGVDQQDILSTTTLRKEIALLDSEIAAADTEIKRYEGGLIRTLHELRSGTLKVTRSMLQQRAEASAFRIRLVYTVDGRTVPSDAAAREKELSDLEHELTTVRQNIDSQRREAAKYSGGLLQVLALSTLATLQQTEAALDQRRLTTKYGLQTPMLPTATGQEKEGGIQRRIDPRRVF